MDTTLILDNLATLVPAGLMLLIPFLTEKLLGVKSTPEFRAVVNAAAAALLGAAGTAVFDGTFAGLDEYLYNILIAWIASGRMYMTEWVKASVSSRGVDR